MSDNEDEYDDLPSISVNSSACDLSVLSMPPAAELASQRAREEETERELLLLRSHQEENSNSLPMRFAHSDSSGSEGEASLAAAVTALQMQGSGSGAEGAAPGAAAGAAPGAAAWAAPHAAELLAALLPPPGRAHRDDFIADYLHAIKHADPIAASQLTDQVVESVSSALVGGCSSWSSAEVVSVGAWLCCACVWRAPAVRRGRVRRALHRLLPGAPCVAALAAALAAAPPLARLHMSDAARSGTVGDGDALANLLLTSVLIDLCKLDGEGEGERDGVGDGDGDGCRWAAVSACVSRSWARLGAGARYLVVGASGRALAAAPPASAHRRRLLAALAHPANTSASTGDRRHPDHLKVLVGASKLQLLFRADK